ncbi:MAG: thermonuclease family protein [Clostridia bacterium]|nr:thermonuclease family protein [Clostridia bacterium]
MKATFTKALAAVLLICSLVSCFAACSGEGEPEHIDYAATVTLNMASESLKTEAEVKAFIDGDTTHFFVSKDVSSTGILKARYLAVNTPESTGKIEVWGKKASNFTKEKLKNATSIILESDNTTWNADSTGDRYLVWVWYKTEEMTEYRNLNIELLQNGLAIASNSGQNRYGETCLAAIDQAKREVLHVHSTEKDPDFCYADAISLDLKELRCNVADYEGQKVAFEGVITMNDESSVYVESYDDETDRDYGMYVYYGFNLSGDGLDILTVGNRVRIVGTVQYWEVGDSYQVSGLQYRSRNPKDPNNIQRLDDEKHDPSYRLTDAKEFATGEVEIQFEEEKKTFSYANLAVYTSVEMKDLRIKSIYTTQNSDSDDKGAMTFTCEAADGTVIDVRTAVLYDENDELITSSYFEGKTIDVKGVIDFYKTEYNADFPYQIKVFSIGDITIK